MKLSFFQYLARLVPRGMQAGNRRTSVRALGLVLMLAWPGLTASGVDCPEFFRSLAQSARAIPEHIREESEFWLRWWRMPRLNPGEAPSSTTMRARVEQAMLRARENLRAAQAVGEDFLTAPVATTASGLRSGARATSETVVTAWNMAREGLSTWRRELSEADGLARQMQRLVLRDRKPEEVGSFGFWETLRDPLTAPLQSHLLRRSLETALLGVRIPAPRQTLTLPASLVVGAVAIDQLVLSPLDRATNAPNREQIQRTRQTEIIGFQAFDSAFQSGVFSSDANAYAALQRHDQRFVRWLTQRAEVFPEGIHYLEAGFFGELNAEESARVSRVLRAFASNSDADELRRQIQQFSPKEKAAFEQVLEMDVLLRAVYSEARNRRQQFAPDARPGLDSVFRGILEERLRGHRFFGEAANYPAGLRRLLLDALDPRFPVDGAADLPILASVARLASLGQAPGGNLAQELAAAQWRNFVETSALRVVPARRAAIELLVRNRANALTEAELGERTRLALAIQGFCQDRTNCRDRLDVIGRRDLPRSSDGWTYRTVQGDQAIRSEFDIWKIIYEDPAFLYLLQQHLGGSPQAAVLAEFRAQAAAMGEIAQIQRQVFAQARAQGAPDWRQGGEIPLPEPRAFCGLLGYGARREANIFYLPIRQALDALESRVSLAQRLSCQQSLVARLWEFQALGAEISELGRGALNPRARRSAQDAMREQLQDQESGLRQVLERCVAGQIPPMPESLQAEFNCQDR